MLNRIPFISRSIDAAILQQEICLIDYFLSGPAQRDHATIIIFDCDWTRTLGALGIMKFDDRVAPVPQSYNRVNGNSSLTPAPTRSS
jgi:hypothetical protein